MNDDLKDWFERLRSQPREHLLAAETELAERIESLEKRLADLQGEQDMPERVADFQAEVAGLLQRRDSLANELRCNHELAEAQRLAVEQAGFKRIEQVIANHRALDDERIVQQAGEYLQRDLKALSPAELGTLLRGAQRIAVDRKAIHLASLKAAADAGDLPELAEQIEVLEVEIDSHQQQLYACQKRLLQVHAVNPEVMQALAGLPTRDLQSYRSDSVAVWAEDLKQEDAWGLKHNIADELHHE